MRVSLVHSIMSKSLWSSVEELTDKSFFLIVSSDTVPFLHSHIMPLFTMPLDSGLLT